jgi:predicted nucleotidyltransferase
MLIVEATATSPSSQGRSGQLSAGDRELIVRRLAPLARRFDARLLLFGSRARGDGGDRSDIDLALKAAQVLPADVLAEAREVLEESLLPFRADLVDYQATSPALRAAIDAEGIEWSV